jgi:hypothetical protein
MYNFKKFPAFYRTSKFINTTGTAHYQTSHSAVFQSLLSKTGNKVTKYSSLNGNNGNTIKMELKIGCKDVD